MISERPFLQRTGISSAHTAAGIWHQLPLVVGARAAGIAPSLLAISSAVPQLSRQAACSRVPRDNPKAKRRQSKERTQFSQVSAGNGRYLCHSRCAWSSPLTPLGKRPPQAQQLPDGWGPLWPPNFLLPDNTRDTKWWQQIMQHRGRQAPRGSIWLGPRLLCQMAWPLL